MTTIEALEAAVARLEEYHKANTSMKCPGPERCPDAKLIADCRDAITRHRSLQWGYDDNGFFVTVHYDGIREVLAFAEREGITK